MPRAATSAAASVVLVSFVALAGVACGDARSTEPSPNGSDTSARPSPPGVAPPGVAPPAEPGTSPPAPKPACHGQPVDVVVYTEDAWSEIADAFAADASACATYYVSIPSLADTKTMPRDDGQPKAIRAHGAGFHALAEFHWGGWAEDTTRTWYEKGVEFRRRMDAAGYDVAAGDLWEINELPSDVRTTAAVRANARDAIRGLHDGPPGAPKVEGAVFVIGMGSNTVNLGPYKSDLKDWLGDAPFWSDVAPRARFWGQETYGAPAQFCLGAATSSWRDHVNAYVEHVLDLAHASPAGTTPEAYLDRAFTPLANAVMDSAGYDTAGVPRAQMERFVSQEVYASRAYAAAHPRARDTIGFGWSWQRATVAQPDILALAKRLAGAIRGAWPDVGGAPADACGPAGMTPDYCGCDLAGAAFNDLWSKTFSTY